jgi:predicted membrane channel-forming protein YqfA (hemolysin III family)
MEPTPLLRGNLHLQSAIVMPFVIYTLYILIPNHIFMIFAEVLISKFILVLSSSILHTSYPDNSIMQSIDHSCIIYSLAAAVRLTDNLGSQIINNFYLNVFLVAMIFNKLTKHNSELSLYDILGMALLMIDWVIVSMNLDKLLYNLVLMIQICTVSMFILYKTRWPKKYDQVFGYHEIIHLLSIIGYVVLLIIIYVVVKRDEFFTKILFQDDILFP